LDRRTNGPEGHGGASRTVVTSRAGGDDLDVDDDQETRSPDIVAAPRRTARKPAATAASVKTAPPNGNSSGHTGNGALVTSEALPDDAPAADAPAGDVPAGDADSQDGPAQQAWMDNGRGAGTDATSAGAVPALPGDNLGPPPTDDWMASDSTQSFAEPFAAEPFSADPAPAPALPVPPLPASPAPASPLPSRPGPASAEPSAMPPAAFVWDMPDPPPTSPSSPARTFLRADANAKSPTPRTPAATVSAKKPAPGPAPAAPPQGTQQKAPSKRSARTAHLTVARVEPWSVMKFSFVVSLVAFVILFVAVSVLYATLSGLGVFDSLQRVVSSLTSSQDSAGVNAAHWFSASRVLSYTAILGSLNIVLITAMSTIGAVVYNLTSRLVGGVEVTLRETE
jgi:transmembrane protein DUF3566